MTTSPLACVILAGGRGTRMKSATPKLLHEACGRPVLAWGLAAVAELAPDRTIVVVGAESDEVRAILPEGVEAVTQAKPLGTGDAARTARSALEGFAGDVVVMNGDHPLTDPASLAGLAAARADAGGAAAVLTFNRIETIGADFGRIVRGPDGSVERMRVPSPAAITTAASGLFDAIARAGAPGFEPGIAGPKPAALPLGYAPTP